MLPGLPCHPHNHPIFPISFKALRFFPAFLDRQILVKSAPPAVSNPLHPGAFTTSFLGRDSMIDLTGAIILWSIPVIAAAMVLIDDRRVQAEKKK
jgi:hypothetical protein